MFDISYSIHGIPLEDIYTRIERNVFQGGSVNEGKWLIRELFVEPILRDEAALRFEKYALCNYALFCYPLWSMNVLSKVLKHSITDCDLLLQPPSRSQLPIKLYRYCHEAIISGFRLAPLPPTKYRIEKEEYSDISFQTKCWCDGMFQTTINLIEGVDYLFALLRYTHPELLDGTSKEQVKEEKIVFLTLMEDYESTKESCPLYYWFQFLYQRHCSSIGQPYRYLYILHAYITQKLHSTTNLVSNNEDISILLPIINNQLSIYTFPENELSIHKRSPIPSFLQNNCLLSFDTKKEMLSFEEVRNMLSKMDQTEMKEEEEVKEKETTKIRRRKVKLIEPPPMLVQQKIEWMVPVQRPTKDTKPVCFMIRLSGEENHFFVRPVPKGPNVLSYKTIDTIKDVLDVPYCEHHLESDWLLCFDLTLNYKKVKPHPLFYLDVLDTSSSTEGIPVSLVVDTIPPEKIAQALFLRTLLGCRTISFEKLLWCPSKDVCVSIDEFVVEKQFVPITKMSILPKNTPPMLSQKIIESFIKVKPFVLDWKSKMISLSSKIDMPLYLLLRKRIDSMLHPSLYQK